jgi:hypothetical protein
MSSIKDILARNPRKNLFLEAMIYGEIFEIIKKFIPENSETEIKIQFDHKKTNPFKIKITAGNLVNILKTQTLEIQKLIQTKMRQKLDNPFLQIEINICK